MIVVVVHPPGASSVPLGFNVSVAATRGVRGAALENDVGSAHCVACGRRVNAPEAGNEGLRDSVAAAATEGDVWSMYASAAWSDIDDWSQRDDTVRRCWAASAAERTARRRTASTRVGGCLVTGPLTW